MTNCFYLFIILSIILLVIYSILALVLRFVKCSHFSTKIIIEILFNKPTHTHTHTYTIKLSIIMFIIIRVVVIIAFLG